MSSMKMLAYSLNVAAVCVILFALVADATETQTQTQTQTESGKSEGLYSLPPPPPSFIEAKATAQDDQALELLRALQSATSTSTSTTSATTSAAATTSASTSAAATTSASTSSTEAATAATTKSKHKHKHHAKHHRKHVDEEEEEEEEEAEDKYPRFRSLRSKHSRSHVRNHRRTYDNNPYAYFSPYSLFEYYYPRFRSKHHRAHHKKNQHREKETRNEEKQSTSSSTSANSMWDLTIQPKMSYNDPFASQPGFITPTPGMHAGWDTPLPTQNQPNDAAASFLQNTQALSANVNSNLNMGGMASMASSLGGMPQQSIPLPIAPRFQQIQTQAQAGVSGMNVQGIPMPYYAPTPPLPPAPNQVPAASAMLNFNYPSSPAFPQRNPGDFAAGLVTNPNLNPAAFVANPNSIAPRFQQQFPFMGSFIQLDATQSFVPHAPSQQTQQQ